MTDAGELLSLLQRADRSFATFDGEYVLSERPRVAQAARAAAIERQVGRSRFAGRRGGSVSGTFSVGPNSGDPGDETQTSRVLLSVEPPDRFREQIGDGEDAIIVVRDGDRWWSYDQFMGSTTNGSDRHPSRSTVRGNLELLVNPVSLLGALRFEAGDTGEHLGRSVIHTRATPVNDIDRPLFGFGHGADQFDLEVDAEHGVILRMQAWFADQELLTVDARRASFDAPLPADTFRFNAPPGAGPAKGLGPTLLRRLLRAR